MKPQKFNTPSPLIPSTLVDRFQELHDALNTFAIEATQFHNSLTVSDEATRALFTSLSRITAYSDQMNMIMALMSEDVRVTDEIGSGPVSRPEFENDEFENCFNEWLRLSRKGGLAVN